MLPRVPFPNHLHSSGQFPYNGTLASACLASFLGAVLTLPWCEKEVETRDGLRDTTPSRCPARPLRRAGAFNMAHIFFLMPVEADCGCLCPRKTSAILVGWAGLHRIFEIAVLELSSQSFPTNLNCAVFFSPLPLMCFVPKVLHSPFHKYACHEVMCTKYSRPINVCEAFLILHEFLPLITL